MASSFPAFDEKKGNTFHLENTDSENVSQGYGDVDDTLTPLDAAEEARITRRLLRKLDLRILPMLAILFLFSFLDR